MNARHCLPKGTSTKRRHIYRVPVSGLVAEWHFNPQTKMLSAKSAKDDKQFMAIVGPGSLKV